MNHPTTWNLSRRRMGAALAVTAVAALGTACGGSDSNAATPSTAAADTGVGSSTTSTRGATIDVVEGKPQELSLVPSQMSAPAGTITFNVANDGQTAHEFVVVPGDSPDAITDGDGAAKEDGSPGEIPEFAAGATKSLTLDLKPGTYILLCNVPGHFAGGMHATFKVT